MIDENRPITLQVPLEWECSGTTAAVTQGFWPFDTLAESEEDVPACSVDWYKDSEEDDLFAASQGYPGKRRYLVKCMEPAVYRLHINGPIPGARFCEYHKPIVREL